MLKVRINHVARVATIGPSGKGGPRTVYRPIRAVAEWIVSAITLIALLPLMLALAIAVRLHSPGPAFYSQVRLGKGGKPFRIYKFRTMTHNCEAASGAIWARENDPRITPLGKLLRDTHLDELPQLWNVLRGEMSLIGPRPERPELARQIETVVPGFARRLSVRPGLTGLAQIRLPADQQIHDVSHKLHQDLIYIRDIGPLLDLKILLCTSLVVIESACASATRLMLGVAEKAPVLSEIEPALEAEVMQKSEPEPEPMLLAA